MPSRLAGFNAGRPLAPPARLGVICPAVEQVYLGLGSNVGDREANAGARARARSASAASTLTPRSSLYLTEPMDAPPQEWFLNAVAGRPYRALPRGRCCEACLEVERELGRVRTVCRRPAHASTSTCFSTATRCVRAPGLTLPHPRLHERRFVLVPLDEIAPDARAPRAGPDACASCCARCPDRSRVLPYSSRGAPGR